MTHTSATADQARGSARRTAVTTVASVLLTSQPPACTGKHADLFFSDKPKDVERAKSLCASCSRREGCLAGAIDRREPWGVWGGQLFKDGVLVPYKRPRGRPRKHRWATVDGTSNAPEQRCQRKQRGRTYE